jgi:DNA-binding CsgD family transcriptional regulator
MIDRLSCLIGAIYDCAIHPDRWPNAMRQSIGFANDNDLGIMHLLAPHIRRAITISDLSVLKTLETSALSAVFDHLSMGIVVVAHENRILHANKAAQDMFSIGRPIASRNGRIVIHNAAAEAELTNAIAAAGRNEAAIGATGIALSIGSPTGEPAIAHVMPLACGHPRRQPMPQATAVVFITGIEIKSAFNFAVLAQTYGLTAAEIRVCERLMAGHTSKDIADDLGVSVATTKTHLTRIFAKTGVSRQADLIHLICRLAPSIRGPRSRKST